MIGDNELGESNIDFFIDDEHFEEIVSFIKENAKKIRVILYAIIQRKYNQVLYEKVKGEKDITAFCFRGKNNFRIYCKDYSQGNRRIIILMVLHHKKSYEFTKKESALIKKLKKYEYELNRQ